MSASDLTYHIDQLRSAIEGFNPDYDGPAIDHWTAPAFTTADSPNKGIPLPPRHRFCWSYSDCDQMTLTTEEIEDYWEDGTIGPTWNNIPQPEPKSKNTCDDVSRCDPGFGAYPIQTEYPGAYDPSL